MGKRKKEIEIVRMWKKEWDSEREGDCMISEKENVWFERERERERMCVMSERERSERERSERERSERERIVREREL